MRRLALLSVLLCLSGSSLACATAKIEWEKLGVLEVVQYSEEQAKKQHEDRANEQWARLLMVAGGARNSKMFVSEAGRVHVSLEGEAFGFGRARRLAGEGWEFCDWPPEAGIRRNERDAFWREIEETIPEKELAVALYRSFLERIDVDKMVARIDGAPVWLLDRFFESSGTPPHDRPWGTMSPGEKRREVETLVGQFSEWLVQEWHDYEWVESGGEICGIVNFRMEDVLIERGWPPTFLSVLGEMEDPPQLIYESWIPGKRLRLYHTFTHRYFIGGDVGNNHYLSQFEGHPFLVMGDWVWTLPRDGPWRKAHPLPINLTPHIGIPPAFFQTDNRLYVFGQLKANPKEAVVLRTDLSQLTSR